MNTSRDLVAKLWGLCSVLKDDGISYHHYVLELSLLLFLKMAEETKSQHGLPPECRWTSLRTSPIESRPALYEAMLRDLGLVSGSTAVRSIFEDVKSGIRSPEALDALVSEIDGIDWYDSNVESFGELYEGLLEKNSQETKAGAGQYFTPRPLVEAMVAALRPRPGEVIQDPAAGTGGFLICADRHIRRMYPSERWSSAERRRHASRTFYGLEHVRETQRLGQMNLTLRGIGSRAEGAGIRHGDTLSRSGLELPSADVILTNPPFGTRRGRGVSARDDFSYPTSNKQLAFLQHVYRGLKVGGRAAVVVPDNVLFEGNTAARVRDELLSLANLHTILRLPTGLFYAQGVRASVLFFSRVPVGDQAGRTWFYDLRCVVPRFTRTQPLDEQSFEGFLEAYGSDPYCGPKAAKRRRTIEDGKVFWSVSREDLARTENRWDLGPPEPRSYSGARVPEGSALLARQTMEHLESALSHIRTVVELLDSD